MIKPINTIKLNRGLCQNFEKKTEDKLKEGLNTAQNFSTQPFNKGYMINFTGILSKKNVAGAVRRDKLRELKYDMTSSAEELLAECSECAKKYKSPEITEYHVIYTSLKKISKYIDGLNNGTVRYSQESTSFLNEVFEGLLGYDLFRDKDLRNAIKPTIDEEIEKLQGELEKQAAASKSLKKTPDLSDKLLNSIYNIFTSDKANLDDDVDDDDKGGFLDSHISSLLRS